MTGSIATTTPRQLAELRKAGSPVDLIDVRTPAEFQAAHAPEARNVPLDQLDPEAIMRSQGDRTLYLICRSGGRGRLACEKFLAAGHSNVANVEGGMAAWEAAGLPVIRGRKAISIEGQVRIIAGSTVLLGVVLGWLVHPALAGLAAFVGAGLVFSGVTDFCGMALLLARMPWNKAREGATCSR